MPGLEKLKEDAFIVRSNDISYARNTFPDENIDGYFDDFDGLKKIRDSSTGRIFGGSGMVKRPDGDRLETENCAPKRHSVTQKKSKSFSITFSGSTDNADGKGGGAPGKSAPLGGSFNGVAIKSPSHSSNGSLTSGRLGFRKKAGVNGKCKDDPFRFAGDGVDFKCKLIGLQEVEQARGDQMCQDAIQTCKAIIKRKGEHKQRIVFNISLEGLKIKDNAGNAVLHSFPVSKVSFIAKDVTDNRAFGFVYGVSDHEHQFYAIKTEKMADQVVYSIRDMFQIVYEMKKKQMEQAKQMQTQRSQNGHQEVIKCKTGDDASTSTPDENVPESDLLDLETELENLEQGMHLMDQWVPPLADWSNGDLSFTGGGSGAVGADSSSSTTWATTSLSSSAIAEFNSNDPFCVEHVFTSSMNSFGSSGGHNFKESFVPLAQNHSPSAADQPHRQNGRQTVISSQASAMFGPPPNSFSLCVGDAFNDRIIGDDPFDTSHVTGILASSKFAAPVASFPASNTNDWSASVYRPFNVAETTISKIPMTSSSGPMTSLVPMTSSSSFVGVDADWPNGQLSSNPIEAANAPQRRSATNSTSTPAAAVSVTPSYAINNPTATLSFPSDFFIDTPRVSSTPLATAPPSSTTSVKRSAAPSIAPLAVDVAVGGGVEYSAFGTNGGGCRLPSAIPPASSLAPHVLSFSGLAAGDEFSSPDGSVFLTNSNIVNKAPSGSQPGFNSAVFNNAMNDTSLFRSFMGADAPNGSAAAIDWSMSPLALNSCSFSPLSPAHSTGSSGQQTNVVGLSAFMSTSKTNVVSNLTAPTIANECDCAAAPPNFQRVSSSAIDRSIPSATNQNAASAFGYSPPSTNQNAATAFGRSPPSTDRDATRGDSLPFLANQNGFSNGSPSSVKAATTTTIPRDDPFAQWRQKPLKKTMNQLRGEQAVVPSDFISQLESLTNANGSGLSNNNFGLESARMRLNSVDVVESSFVPPPSLPPRLPPPSKAKTVLGSSRKRADNDPFADKFFK